MKPSEVQASKFTPLPS